MYIYIYSVVNSAHTIVENRIRVPERRARVVENNIAGGLTPPPFAHHDVYIYIFTVVV